MSYPHETNPLSQADVDMRKRIDHSQVTSWDDPNLKTVTRLRLLSDPGFPVWDVSYCYGLLKDDTPVRVSLPFSQVPKRGYRKFIVEQAKRDGVYAKGLGILDNISTLI